MILLFFGSTKRTAERIGPFFALSGLAREQNLDKKVESGRNLDINWTFSGQSDMLSYRKCLRK